MNERRTIFVLSSEAWFDVWSSGQTRYEGSPAFRLIDSEAATQGLAIRPDDAVIYGDTTNWSTFTRLRIYENVELAKLVGAKL